MSGNIIITEGIKEPWELRGTNYDKPEEIVLANLAVGQLAFVGSSFGKYLSTQATVTAELAQAVNRVRDRSAEVASLFQSWSIESPKLDLIMPASGAYPVESSVVNLNSANPSAIDKLVIANNLLDQNKIANKFLPPLNTDVSTTTPQSYTYTFQSVSNGRTITGLSTSIGFYNPYELNDPPVDFQLYVKADADGVFDYSKNFVRFQGLEYEVKDIKQIWVPKSSAEIDYFNNQLGFINPAKNSKILSDTTQLVPVPSELSSSPPAGSDNIPQAAVTLEIPITGADFIEFKLEDNGYFYFDKPADQIPLYDANTVGKHAGSVVQMADKTYSYVVKSETAAGISYTLIKATARPGVKDPTNLQKSEWLSQYSDKVVRITQRSSEQTTYVNALVQRYNYFFEAATNVLKSFTSLWASLSGNI